MIRYRPEIFAASIMLCHFLAACGQVRPEAARPPLSDLSMVQRIVPSSEEAGPVSYADKVEYENSHNSMPEPQPFEESVTETFSEPEKSAEPPPEPESVNPGLSSSEAENANSGQPVPDLLNAVAPEQKLDREAVERELLRLINELREANGVEALGSQEDMAFAARIRSEEALESFSHTRPNGSPYNTAFDEAGFSYAGKWHGENLASLSFTDGMFDEKAAALEMFVSLRNSPGHYRNMTGADFLQAGIGVSITVENDIVRVASAQLFASL